MHVPEIETPVANTFQPCLHWRTPDRLRIVAVNFPGSKKKYGEAQLPCLKLRGMWMTLAGFNVDDRVNVQVERGRVILTLEEPTDVRVVRAGRRH